MFITNRGGEGDTRNIVTCVGRVMIVTAIMKIMKTWLGHMSGYISPYPTVENVTTTNQKDWKMLMGRSLPLCKCSTPQALQTDQSKNIISKQIVICVVVSPNCWAEIVKDVSLQSKTPTEALCWTAVFCSGWMPFEEEFPACSANRSVKQTNKNKKTCLCVSLCRQTVEVNLSRM